MNQFQESFFGKKLYEFMRFLLAWTYWNVLIVIHFYLFTFYLFVCFHLFMFCFSVSYSLMSTRWPTNFCSPWPQECHIPLLVLIPMENFVNPKLQWLADNHLWFWIRKLWIVTIPIQTWPVKKNWIPVVYQITMLHHLTGNYLTLHTKTSMYAV